MSMRIRPLEPLGAEATAGGVDALLRDERTPALVLDALEQHGVLIFPEVGFDDDTQVAFARRLGPLATRRKSGVAYGPGANQDIYRVGFGNDLDNEVQVRGAFDWHLDGTTDPVPSKASLLSARSLSTTGGGDTQFVSTYAAYERLSDEDKERFADLKVRHSVEAAYRRFEPDPVPEVLERLRRIPSRVHPLVWMHRSGRRSLVLGTTADAVEGMAEDEGRALLSGLVGRATEPEHVFTHEWALGDLVIWDNRGTLHRATPYGEESGRMMHRVTLEGDEPIE